MVERFGADAEGEILHTLFDVVSAAPSKHFLVGNRVVRLEVDDVKQRRDLRELVGHGVHHVGNRFLVVFAEDNDEHHFSGRNDAHHQRTHKSLLRFQVVERVAAVERVPADEQAYAVRQVVLQVAFVDVEHLVECAGNVKSQSVTVGKLFAAAHLLERQPTLVGEGIFQFVAIAERLFRT